MHACIQTQRVRGVCIHAGDQEEGPLHQRDQITVGTSRDQGPVLGGVGDPESCLVDLFFCSVGAVIASQRDLSHSDSVRDVGPKHRDYPHVVNEWASGGERADSSSSHGCLLTHLLRSKHGTGPQAWQFQILCSFPSARELPPAG